MTRHAVMLLDNHHGPDRRVQYESSLLARDGWQVTIVAWDRRLERSEPEAEAEEHGVQVVRLHAPAPPGGGKKTFVKMLKYGRQVWTRRHDLVDDADIVVVHDVYLLPLGWFLAKALRLPFVYDAHEEYAAMEGGRYPRWWLSGITRMETVLARSAALVVVPGESRVPRFATKRLHPIVLRNIGAQPRMTPSNETPHWDLAYAGTLADVRRVDLLVAIADKRPDLRIAVAGRGRAEAQLQAAAKRLPNLTYYGWLPDPESILRNSRAVYYGLDPGHPYSEKACPNNLYEAIRIGRPLIFFCGGEVASVADRYRIGCRASPSADGVIAALDEAAVSGDWEFDEAWAALSASGQEEGYERAVDNAASSHRRS